MTDDRIRISLTRLLYSALIVVAVVSASRFVYVTVEGYRLHEEVKRLEKIVSSDEKAYNRLLQQKDYVMSPEYTERVARDEFQMAKEGEVNITPIFPANVDQQSLWTPRPTTQTERPPSPNWQKWWDVFFPPDG